jgi:hypothetical protein
MRNHNWMREPETWPALAMLAQVIGVWLGLALIYTYG